MLLEAIEAFLTTVSFSRRSEKSGNENSIFEDALKRGLFSGKCFLVVFVLLHIIFTGQLDMDISIGKI